MRTTRRGSGHALVLEPVYGPGAEGKLVYFMSIDDCRFRRPVKPGDVIKVYARVEELAQKYKWRRRGAQAAGRR